MLNEEMMWYSPIIAQTAASQSTRTFVMHRTGQICSANFMRNRRLHRSRQITRSSTSLCKINGSVYRTDLGRCLHERHKRTPVKIYRFVRIKYSVRDRLFQRRRLRALQASRSRTASRVSFLAFSFFKCILLLASKPRSPSRATIFCPSHPRPLFRFSSCFESRLKTRMPLTVKRTFPAKNHLNIKFKFFKLLI